MTLPTPDGGGGPAWSWWQRLSFSWASPLLAMGRRRQLDLRVLYDLPPELQPAACGRLLWRAWEAVSAVRSLAGPNGVLGRGRARGLPGLGRG